MGKSATVRGLTFILAVCLTVATSATVGTSVAKGTSVVVKSDARLEQAALSIDDGKFGTAVSLVDQAISSNQLSVSDADWAAYLKARALAASGSFEAAEQIVRDRQRAHPNGYNWASLVSILMSCGRHEEAAHAVLELEEGDFVLTNRLRPQVVETILSALEAKSSPLRDQMVTRLVEGRYSGPSSQHVPDGIRLRYINLLLRQSRLEDAARETLSLESPAILSILLTDKSFAPLWDRGPVRQLFAPGALVARVERGVQARLEQRSMTSSDWLELMRSLRVIGKAEEAVRLGLHAIEQARSNKRAAGSALRLEIANGYADLGETWAARRTARELLKEQSSLPVSLRVSVAHVLEITGDDEGALLLLSTLEGADKLAGALKTTVCAAQDLGRPERQAIAMAMLEAMRDAAPVELMDAYVCSGESVKAARVLVSMFERPEYRTSAILTAQLYSDTSKAGTDLSDLRYRMRALVATNEVQDAIKSYARTMGLPFAIAVSR